jgi:hypothetical protein
MTPQARIRRIGWFALMMICTALYGVLHFQVWSLSSEVTKAERVIVNMEEQNMLLETEFLTRSNQVQLAAWNRVDFGYKAPEASQFISGERQLAQFGSPRHVAAPEQLQFASFSSDDDGEVLRQLVSPITGEPIDVALVEPSRQERASSSGLVVGLAARSARVPLSASASPGGVSVVRIALGGAGQ